MKNILITGGAGFIGSNLAKKLGENNKVIVIDNLSMGLEKNLQGIDNLTFFKGSVLDKELMESIFQNNQFDFIFHLAAIASVVDSVNRPIETHMVNFDSTIFLLELIKKYQKKLDRLVFSSSAAVYGNNAGLPKKEDSVIMPLTPYAVDKFASERYVLNAFKLYGIKASATRFFNVYGINQNPSSPYSGVISILVNKYLELINGSNAEFTLYGDGEQTRDYVYVDDVVEALILISESKESVGEVFNVGNGKEVKLIEVKQILDNLFGIDLKVCHLPRREGDILRSYADISKLKSIGFEPKASLYEGLEKYTGYEKRILEVLDDRKK